MDGARTAAASAAPASGRASHGAKDKGAAATATATPPAHKARAASARIHTVLDFYLTGAKLVRRGDKVRVVIDKREYPTVRAWKPLSLTLKPGVHHITIDLLDRRGTKVRNALNRSDRTFTLRN
jgi:hypothetical protein